MDESFFTSNLLTVFSIISIPHASCRRRPSIACRTFAMTRADKRDQRLLCVAVDYPIMWPSKLIPRDVERAVENPKDIDVPVVLHEIRDPVMPV